VSAASSGYVATSANPAPASDARQLSTGRNGKPRPRSSPARRSPSSNPTVIIWIGTLRVPSSITS
jgi:hypothetical protein